VRDVQSLGIEVRAGLHTGECEVPGDDIGGIGVHIGARVSALARPNEVLVSSTLRDLMIGSGLEFEERGSYELKGVPGEWAAVRRRLCANDIGRAARDADAGTKRFQQRWLSIQPQIVLGS
jgi:class 3 adenylate cyclase